VLALWVNGTFGVGKTSAAQRIVALDDQWRLFDPEWVGYMLRANLTGVEFADFQDMESWRTLVPVVANEVATTLSAQKLLSVQTVIVERYWFELRQGFERQGFDVMHVVLDCEAGVLEQRIADDVDDPGAAQWRLAHIDDFGSARAWMVEAADLVVDTTERHPDEVAAIILEAVG
jgi:broad-specificity NMP kinase